jgi:hypothetical protein
VHADILKQFGSDFRPEESQVGVVQRTGGIFLMVTLDKQGMQAEHKYQDRFLSPTDDIAVLILKARSKRLEHVIELVPALKAALVDLKPGSALRIHPPNRRLPRFPIVRSVAAADGLLESLGFEKLRPEEAAPLPGCVNGGLHPSSRRTIRAVVKSNLALLKAARDEQARVDQARPDVVEHGGRSWWKGVPESQRYARRSATLARGRPCARAANQPGRVGV